MNDDRRIGWGPEHEGLRIRRKGLEWWRRLLNLARDRGYIEGSRHDPAFGPLVYIRLDNGESDSEYANVLNWKWERA